jgi:hypothetical protein
MLSGWQAKCSAAVAFLERSVLLPPISGSRLLSAAASLIAEADAAAQVTGSHVAPYPHMILAALRGNEDELTPLMAAAIAAAEGQAQAETFAHWMAAIVQNGLGRYDDASAAAREAREHSHLFSAS